MFNEMRRAAWAEIQLGAIRDNYLMIRGLAPRSEVIACLKADAYGHGIVKAAWELVQSGVEYLGVATLDEAIALRSAGIRTKVVLLSALPRGNVQDAIDLNLIPVVTTYTDAKLLSDAVVSSNKTRDILYFIALETGMGRLGFMSTPESLADITTITSLPGLRLVGIFSHFAAADEPDLSFARAQLDAFNAFDAKLRDAGIRTEKRTIANSAAIIALPASHFEIVRPGITLYGLYPSETMDRSQLKLNPVMSVKANIVYLKKTPSGFPISYGRLFTTQRESLIATLPIGYGDGLPRIATGKERALIRGRYAPIVGLICMDQCMVDVTGIPGVTEYDEAVLMGAQGERRIPAEEIAANSGTNVYEVVCRFGQRLPRKYL